MGGCESDGPEGDGARRGHGDRRPAGGGERGHERRRRSTQTESPRVATLGATTRGRERGGDLGRAVPPHRGLGGSLLSPGVRRLGAAPIQEGTAGPQAAAHEAQRQKRYHAALEDPLHLPIHLVPEAFPCQIPSARTHDFRHPMKARPRRAHRGGAGAGVSSGRVPGAFPSPPGLREAAPGIRDDPAKALCSWQLGAGEAL